MRLRRTLRDLALTLVILGLAILLSLALAGIDNDNNPFAMAVFLLAVVLVARATNGYFWGIAASLLGTFCVNYIFTYPFWSFDITYPGYPLTFAVMLFVSLTVSALTSRVKQQEQLRLAVERETMRSNLLRAIAHDLRTPLASILGASSALREQKLPTKDREALISGIQLDAEWLVRVTENLLSVTRITGGEVALKKEEEVLEEIIGSAIVKYRREPGALPVLVDTPDQILVVPMEGVLIEQVLINLFENVSTHAEGATRIWLHLQQERDRTVLSVEDDGCGIDEARQAQITAGAVPQSNRQSDGQRSMGIGLSVCRSIILAHGGELTIGKSKHGGAAIRFGLPAEKEA